MEIRALRPEDNRAAFACGDESLDRFFRHYSGQNQFRHYLGVTYVAIEKSRILGFITVAPRHIVSEDLPAAARRKLPRYPLPALGIARLGTDVSAQSQGVGKQLLRFALKLAAKMAADFGCAGVLVDAKPKATDYYAKYGFKPFLPLEGRSEARPRPIPMWLRIQDILAAEA